MNDARREQLIHSFYQRARIVGTLNLSLAFNEAGQATVTLPYRPGYDHALGGIHGGIYAVVIDSAGWFTAAARRDVSTWVATSELTIHFLAPSKETDLRATGSILKPGKRQDIVQIDLFDGDDKAVGHAVGTFVALPGVDWTDG